jgi:predicted AlkP superfamily phosphohydrolase/phosphomutase
MLDGDTAVMVVSDHGARTMQGGICVNEWMLREGHLTLAGERPERPTALEKLEVDWGRTRAWGEGGYYARIFLNVRGREPQGVVALDSYERVRDEIAAGLKVIRGPKGEDLGTVVYKPQEIYRAVKGIPPDLLVYFGDLAWRSVGSLGPRTCDARKRHWPDEANHAATGFSSTPARAPGRAGTGGAGDHGRGLDHPRSTRCGHPRRDAGEGDRALARAAALL